MGTPVNQSGRAITNVRYPSSNDDAANKQYVDDQVGGGGAALSGTSLALAQGIITTAVPVIGATSTWNAGGVTFTGWKLNVTNTASAAASLLMDLQVGGASRLSVNALTGFTGINTNAPGAVLDAFGWAVIVGADASASTNITRTDNTNKQAVLACPNFTNVNNPYPLIAGVGGNGSNAMSIGGGVAGFGSCTSITFFSSSNSNTAVGTQRMSCSVSGLTIGNVGAQTGCLHVQQDASVTGATAIPNVFGTVTWNNGTTVQVGWQLKVTDTASAAASLLLDLQVGGNSMYKIGKGGSPVAAANTAIPAGGTAGVGLMMSSTANYGVFFGSGAPTLSAAKGSLYLRSDGSATNNRAYINTDGGTTWTALTTAA